MNTASLELCKELYELSGWEDTTHRYTDSLNVTRVVEYKGKKSKHHLAPAYDLGYLLRKFQDDDLTLTMRWNRDMGGRAAMKSWDNKWCIGTFDMPQGRYPVADTPEDAAAMLAIELFKQGVLIKEEI